MVRDRLGYATRRLVRLPSDPGGKAGRRAGAERIILVAGEQVAVRAGPPATALLDPVEADQAGRDGLTVDLGLCDGRPIHARAVEGACVEALGPACRLVDLRTLAAEEGVPPHELGLLATAKSILGWHARHGFCARCGGPTRPGTADFRRECAACGAHHFPRTDPVVIMLVERDGACLLGRAPHFPKTLFSCLAGFVEPGETLEDAVRRETLEEANVAIGAVRYHASQPWPFPSSLMIGCFAQALSAAIRIDPAELAEARWFPRAEVAAMLGGTHPGGLVVPPPSAIAHLLMHDFVAAAGRVAPPAG